VNHSGFWFFIENGGRVNGNQVYQRGPSADENPGHQYGQGI
jgi:hypothetical protein